ncbi:UPF0764 protein C16orf89 homolog [Hyalella azteca]|uniref:UPF0764 protein C16orf89 homolog n=1 Tax=Hyalella azteca TaxID=294128 RepID=A0A8B7N1X7_HYAAZ|nr:UPF0764 protein C16orf89 homolog [Hyalella azteca]
MRVIALLFGVAVFQSASVGFGAAVHGFVVQKSSVHDAIVQSIVRKFAGHDSVVRKSAGHNSVVQRSVVHKSAGHDSVVRKSTGPGSVVRKSAGHNSVVQRSVVHKSAGPDSVVRKSTGPGSVVQRSVAQKSADPNSVVQKSAGHDSVVRKSAGHDSVVRRSADHDDRARVSPRYEAQERQQLLQEVASSFKKLTSFIAEEAQNGNDDLLLSIRITQGQLAQLQSDSPRISDSPEISRIISSAEADLASAADLLLQNFGTNPDLSEQFSFMMDPELWKNMKRINAEQSMENFEELWLRTFGVDQNQDREDTDFDEVASDECLSQLRPLQDTDSSNSDGRSSHCAVSDRCWRMMATPETGDYQLTHQLLYFALGLSAGCGPEFAELAQRGFADSVPTDVTHELMRRQCSRVLEQAQVIAADGYPDFKKDLFLEQGFLCGAAVNKPEFFEPSMIRSALSWQKSSGCYGFIDVEAYLSDLSRADPARIPDAERGLENTRSQNAQVKSALKVGRIDENKSRPKARREKVMNESCLAHNSAVAMGYLSVALRYLMDQ